MDIPASFAAQSHLPAVSEGSTSVVELLNQTLQQALVQRASDIHFEPFETRYRVRVRIDGMLRAVADELRALTAQFKLKNEESSSPILHPTAHTQKQIAHERTALPSAH